LSCLPAEAEASTSCLPPPLTCLLLVPASTSCLQLLGPEAGRSSVRCRANQSASHFNCDLAGTLPLSLHDITTSSVASHSTYGPHTPQAMMHTQTRPVRSPYLSDTPTRPTRSPYLSNSPGNVLQESSVHVRSSTLVGSEEPRGRSKMLYEEGAGLKPTKGEFINSITPALYSISAAAESKGVAAKP
jgi:hypothetical protein